MFVWQLHSISCLLTMSILFLRNLLYLISLQKIFGKSCIKKQLIVSLYMSILEAI